MEASRENSSMLSYAWDKFVFFLSLLSLYYEDISWLIFLVSISSCVLALVAAVYNFIRRRFPIKVNCWFCNSSQLVPYDDHNHWECIHCDQYNGFSKDGDYNKTIPALYESLPKKYVARTSQCMSSDNGFCTECNLKQQLKISALANFTPKKEKTFDKEVDSYKKRLELEYPLCRNCEAVLRQTLGHQDSYLRPKLLSWKLQNNCLDRTNYSPASQKITVLTRFGSSKFAKYFRAASLVLLFTSLFHHLHQLPITAKLIGDHLSANIGEKWTILLSHHSRTLSICGLINHLTVCTLLRTSFLSLDVLTMLLWVSTLSLPSIVVRYGQDTLSNEQVQWVNIMWNGCLVLMLLANVRHGRSSKRRFCFARKFQSTEPIENKLPRMEHNLQNARTHLKFSPPQRVSSPTLSKKNGLNTSLGAMSLGKENLQKLNKKHAEGVFSRQTYSAAPSPTLFNNDTRSPVEDLHKRPLVLPARFQPQNSFVKEPFQNWNQCPLDWNLSQYGTLPKQYFSPVQGYYNQFPSSPVASHLSSIPMFTSLHGGYCNYPWEISSMPSQYYPASLYMNKPGSVYGEDRGSVYSEPAYAYTNRSPASTSRSVYATPMANDHLEDSGSDHGSHSSSPQFDTPTSFKDMSFSNEAKDKTRKRSSGSWLLLILSLSFNITVISYCAYRYFLIHSLS